MTVLFTVTGANANSGSAITDANGIAMYTYTGANSGTDTVQASWSSQLSNLVNVSWVSPLLPIATSNVFGQFFSSNPPSYYFDTPPSATPEFTQWFPAIFFNPPSSFVIPGNTSGVSPATRPFTNVATDADGNYTGTIVAQGNGYQAGAGSMASFQAVFTGSYNVAAAGDAVISIFVDNGFILGIGGGATRISGPMDPVLAVTPFEQLPVIGAAVTNIGAYQIAVHFPAPGSYPFELDHSECCSLGGGDTVSLVMMAGTPNPDGTAPGLPPSGSLTLSPNTVPSLATGSQQTFTVLAVNASGAPAANLNVNLIVSGPNNTLLSGVTDATGNATISYVGAAPGTDSVQAVAVLSGMMANSNAVTVSWTGSAATQTSNGPGAIPSLTVTAQASVTLPNLLPLSASVSDSNLPPGGSVTLTWSKVSGPGAVTFTSPTQAITNAAFSVAGSYVLKLSATDSVNSSSVQIPVTVYPMVPITSGWIVSPLDGATVSGVVPIVLATGVTLASGALSYSPAADPAQIHVLNPATSGAGQIGTLDTTVLANGAYWVQLEATDASGKSQNNLAMITVAGNYKPGRVTATVTDLVVPAKGLAIKIQRSYDSLNKDRVSDFGYGWSLGIRVDLEVSPKNDVTFTLGGQRRTFYFTPQSLFGGPFAGIGLYLPQFTPEPGLAGALASSGPGCMLGPYAFWDVLLPDGSIWLCDTGGVYSPPGYVYTDQFGTEYSMGSDGTLQSVKDLNGNTLTVTAGGITSSTGLSVPFVRDTQGRITEITDPLLKNYTYGYDASGNLGTVTYPKPDPSTAAPQTTYTYWDSPAHLYKSGTDARSHPLPTAAYTDGRLTSVTDALTQTTSYSYDVANHTTTTTFPDTGSQTIHYDDYGMPLTVTDPLQHTTTNVYDANHNLTSTTDPLGHTTTFTYDSNGNQLSKTYPRTATSVNTTSRTVYNKYSEPDGTQDELGNVRAFAYDANFLPSSVIDNVDGAPVALASFVYNPDGTMQKGAIGYDLCTNPEKATTYVYDTNGNLLSKTDALGRQTSWTYDALNRKHTQIDPSTAVTTFYYDDLSRLTSTAAPLGRTTNSQYDGNGNKISDTDANGKTTSYGYDELNRVSTITYPTASPNTVTRTYDFRGNILDETDQLLHVTHHVYDLAGRLTSVTRAYGTSDAAPTNYTYYADGRKQTETDPRNNTTTYFYDEAGRLTSVQDAKTNTTHYAYDDAGNRTSITDANGHTTQFQYDARKRLRKTTYNDSSYTTNSYDNPGNLTAVTDQAAKTVTYTYDAANQLGSVIQTNHPDPAHNTTTYGYDPNGNLITATDANGHLTQTPSNALNEQTGITLPDGTLTETRTYDYAGNLATLRHFNGKTTTYAYDPLNRLLSKTSDPSLNEPVESFTYTPTGRRASMTDASGLTTYGYDNQDRLTSKATPWGTLNYTYDSAGNVATMTSSNTGGISVAYTYDELSRLATVTDSSGVTSYTYDPATNLATATYPNGLQSTFTYDDLNRLKALNGYQYQLGPTGNRQSATEPNGRAVSWNYDGIYRLTNETDSAHGAVSYGLDPVGNRLSQNSTIAGIPTGTFGYDADDRLSTEQYDNNGNTTVSGARTFAYDFENRLKSMNNGAVTMLYDADGNRVGKNTTRYLVDELNPTGYAQVVEELTGSTVTRRYTYGLQRISQTQSGTTSFYGYDGFGSVRQLTDSTGAVTDTYDYDAWGNTVNVTGSIPNVYRYRGEQYDADLNLYYLRARYFNPLAGRFLARDSASGEVLNPSSWHKYIYAVADPIDRSDPSGQQAIFEDTILTSTRTVAWQVASAALIAGTIACIWMKAADWLEVASLVPVSGVRQTRCHVRARRSDEDPDANAMRVQLQEGNRTLATVPKMNYSDPGVTVGQMREALQQLWDQGARQIPVSARPRFRSAIIETSLQYGLYPPGGVSKGGRFYYREFNDDRGVTYRVDSDNLRGTNLRE